MKRFLRILGCLLLIALASALTYIFTPRPYQVHWHANFAVYIDGQKWDFSQQKYMEEVSRCDIATDIKPQDRIHLHDGNGDVVHVHAAASTWGDLFANLGWGIGSTYIDDDQGVLHLQSGTGQLYYFINGQPVFNPADVPVLSTDRLLVWYGTGTSAQVQARASGLVADTASTYNATPDPASCGSNTYGWLSPIATPLTEVVDHHHE